MIASVFGFGMWVKLIHQYSPTQVTPFALLVPVFGMLSAYLVLGDAMNRLQIIAASLVILGLAIITQAAWLRERLAGKKLAKF
ncbi:MAG: EamA family transporter [Deinococcales bacterium]